jgi:hypothetical protein
MDRNRVLGGILGVVTGDALGLPVQFESRERRRQRPVRGMEGWGVFNMPPGSISDDGSLTLCLAESICEAGISPQDAAKRFLRWYQEGHWTPLGYAYDIGGATARAMETLKRGVPAVEAGPAGENDNGNGSLMRILPAALYLANADVKDLAEGIWDMSRITHGHPRACSACYIYALLVRELLTGVSPDEAYRRLCSQPEDILGLELTRKSDLIFSVYLMGTWMSCLRAKSAQVDMWLIRWKPPSGVSSNTTIFHPPCWRPLTWEMILIQWGQLPGDWPASYMVWKGSRMSGSTPWSKVMKLWVWPTVLRM